MIRIWHISDTHTDHEQVKEIPDNIDLVIHSGDAATSMLRHKNEREMRDFITWYDGLDIPNKVFVAGNHDVCIEQGLITEDNFKQLGIHYLENDWVEVEGLKIWGSPFTPTYGGDWAFNKARHKLFELWKHIPEDVDILVTHGPPKGILDLGRGDVNNLVYCGCNALMGRIEEIQPKFSLFGHIHNQRDIPHNAGIYKDPNLDTVFSNASMVTNSQFGELTSNGNVLVSY